MVDILLSAIWVGGQAEGRRVQKPALRRCRIRGAIIDKNARIGRDVVIEPFPRGVDRDGDNWVVRDGIVVIPKDAFIRPGTYIGPEA